MRRIYSECFSAVKCLLQVRMLVLPSIAVTVAVTTIFTRKLSYRKDDCAMHPMYGCPENFSIVCEYAHSYFFQKFLWAFVPIEPLNVRTNFEVRSFNHS